MKRAAISLIAVLAVLFAPGVLFALQEPSPQANQQEEMQAPSQGEMQAPSQGEEMAPWPQMTHNMMTMRGRIMARVQQMNAELDQKVAAMNAATNQTEEIQAMKGVIDELVSQRKEMMSNMMFMHGRWCGAMGHMRGMWMDGEKGGPVTIHRKKHGKNMIVIIQE